MAIFDPPQNRHPSTDHQKICHRWLRRRPLRLCQIRCISVQGELLGTWMKYNQIIFIYTPFLRNAPTGQTSRRIFTHDGSNDADSRKDVPFFWIFHIAPHLWGQKPQKPSILGQLVFRTFKNLRWQTAAILKNRKCITIDIINSLLEPGNKTANINVKNCSLYTLLTATDRKPQKS